MPSSGSSSLSIVDSAGEIVDVTKQFFQRLSQTKVIRHEATYHVFKSFSPRPPATYCSQCNEAIFVVQQAKICIKCHLVCHDKCIKSLRFKCANITTSLPKHRFRKTFFATPTYCRHCGLLIPNIFKAKHLSCDESSGGCGITIHEECRNSINRPCSVVEETRSPIAISLTDFDLIDSIGSGSFSAVHLVRMKSNGKKFALKVVEKANQTISNDPESVLTEMRVLQFGEHHPFLTRVHCCFQTKERLFFVIEYLDGETLLVHLEKAKKFTEGSARFYSAEIALAIKFLHDKGVVHRDLKLENVIIGRDGHCKLIDFGMSKFLDQSVDMKTRTFCGTPYYMSPEMIKGLEYSFSCDWWALGVLMYELLVGHLPFNLSAASNEPEVLYKMIVEGKLFVPEFSTEETQELLNGLLTKAPEERFGWASLERHPFFRFKDRDGSREHQWEAIKEKQIKPPSMLVIEKVNSRHQEPLHKLVGDSPTISDPLGAFCEFDYCSNSFESLLRIEDRQ